jgi:hypothetical protein
MLLVLLLSLWLPSRIGNATGAVWPCSTLGAPVDSDSLYSAIQKSVSWQFRGPTEDAPVTTSWKTPRNQVHIHLHKSPGGPFELLRLSCLYILFKHSMYLAWIAKLPGSSVCFWDKSVVQFLIMSPSLPSTPLQKI